MNYTLSTKSGRMVLAGDNGSVWISDPIDLCRCVIRTGTHWHGIVKPLAENPASRGWLIKAVLFGSLRLQGGDINYTSRRKFK